MTITNEDNMQLMARYPDNYFNLTDADPLILVARKKEILRK